MFVDNLRPVEYRNRILCLLLQNLQDEPSLRGSILQFEHDGEEYVFVYQTADPQLGQIYGYDPPDITPSSVWYTQHN